MLYPYSFRRFASPLETRPSGERSHPCQRRAVLRAASRNRHRHRRAAGRRAQRHPDPDRRLHLHDHRQGHSDNQPGGDNTPLNSVILQAPGVAQDSFGQLHIRGEHNGLQYRLNGIILPEGISVFGQTLDPRLAECVRLITGALPAEYGNRTAGIIDIQTKTGLFDNGGEISIYGGSHSTLTPVLRLWRLVRAASTISSPATTPPTRWASKARTAAAIRGMTAPSSITASALPAGHSGPEQQRHRDPGHLQRHVPDSQSRSGFSPPGSTASSGWGRRIPAAAILCCRPTARRRSRRQRWTSASARSPITAS